MADKPRALFLCTGNSCRSQMAEGWLRRLAGDRVEALSAGVDPHGLNPFAVRVMTEAGVDISAHTSDPIGDFLADPPEVVIAVCDRAAESCPAFPGATQVLSWPFPDPAGATGSEEEVLAVFRDVRDAIRARIAAWLADGAAPLPIKR
ncbi:MAG: arsenate reductase ArsC [Planctomycetota bacterium]|nr:arsenate reductase ArsC [Planctomycetota bacterium]